MPHPRQSIFPTIPRGQVRSLEHQSVQIDGMDVQFDERISLFPVKLEIVKHGDTYTATPDTRRPSRTRHHSVRS